MAITASFSPGAGTESNGALPPAKLFADVGYDVLIGGSGYDRLFGRCCGGRHNG